MQTDKFETMDPAVYLPVLKEIIEVCVDFSLFRSFYAYPSLI